jgi:ketosteroid isomerase-like protein
MTPDPIAEAKAVLASHEQYAMAGDLDGVMSNVATDIVVLAAGAPLIEGRDAFEQFYGAFLAMGDHDFGHDYSGAEAVSEIVILHGVSRGRIDPPDGEPMAFENNFLHMLRRDHDGRLRVWRAAFAPAEG